MSGHYNIRLSARLRMPSRGFVTFVESSRRPHASDAFLLQFCLRRTIAMASPRILILRAPGANCDQETEFAFERAGGIAERVHINRLRQAPALLREYQILVIPGG